jgi:tetratricopeptide (TPR) repeat protein
MKMDESIQIPPHEIFQRVRVLVESRQYISALTLLELVEKYGAEKDWKFPTKGLILSYRGLCMARGQKQTAAGLRLCQRAVEMEFYHPDCWLNLGRLHLDRKRRKEAYECFRKGLKLDADFALLKKEISLMGLRGKPPISFLSRGNPLNRLLGRLRNAPKPADKPKRK